MNHGWNEFIGRLLGEANVESIGDVSPSLAAPWAQNGPVWVLLGCVGLIALAMIFYLRWQTRGATKARIALAVVRGLLLALILLLLAEPVLQVTLVSRPAPTLWVLFDGSDSMNIQDELPDEERRSLAEAVGLAKPGQSPADDVKRSRLEYVQEFLKKPENNVLRDLQQKFRLRAFTFDRTDGVRELNALEGEEETVSPEKLATELQAPGEVTALGAALSDLARRRTAANLAGVVVVSDFDQNSGPPPLESAKRLGAPVYAVGLGPTTAVDLAIDLRTPLVLKKSERTTLAAILRQTGLEGRSVKVTLAMRRLGGSGSSPEVILDTKTATLAGSQIGVEFPYTPEQTGAFEMTASVDVLEGEVVAQNNKASREVNIRDDFLRLFFVEYEPTWEWRFIKEVFYRDSLVGQRGFRTYLWSADPKVRKSRELFLPTLTPPRSDFFASDVIFLGDLPASAISGRFCELTKEFVSTFGGGLVVLSGPRYGASQLAGTPLADMLPVVVDPDAKLQDDKEFKLTLTPEASLYDFMRLGDNDRENAQAWANLDALPWYRPVKRLHPSASTALAVHPTAVCDDGRTPQPIIAIRRYGRGQVVYVGVNETWRLRREFGEKYYRQFWGQMIHRLGLSHAIGAQKRFVVRTDRQQYQSDETALVTVEAYDENFEPLTTDKLTAEIVVPGRTTAEDPRTEPLTISLLKEGVYESRLPVVAGGEYRVRVRDPITSDVSEVDFRVADLSVERRSAVRNAALQQSIAQETGGRSYSLATAKNLLSDVPFEPKIETSLRVIPLWNTWACFVLVVVLMLGEWLFRKLVNLP